MEKYVNYCKAVGVKPSRYESLQEYYRLKRFVEFVNDMDFDLTIKDNGLLALIDCQGVNLGGIESEEYNSPLAIIDRLTMYEQDYYIDNISESVDSDWKDWKELYELYTEECNGYYKFYKEVLDLLVNGDEYEELKDLAHITEYMKCNNLI